jgi:uncharacterized protein (DUF1684 family)
MPTHAETTHAESRGADTPTLDAAPARTGAAFAVNLPCAYTDLATYPLPPAENRLPVAIEAGEQIPYERQDPS